jgi:hypothetical protein
MVDKIIGKLPEFTSDETPTEETGEEEVKEAPTEEVEEEETETPSELPAEETPAEPEGEGDDVGELQKQAEALKREREELLKDIQGLRGERRDLKQKQVEKVEEAIDDLKGVHPNDVALIEKVLKSKGYVRKDDVEKRIYEETKQQALDTFLSKHPEFKPENDPRDANWMRLQKELEYYRMPQDPKKIGEVLERAHRALGGSGGQDMSAKKHRAQVAGAGGAGMKSPSSGGNTLSPEQKEQYRRGGWSEEDIQKIEQKLP